MIPRKKRRLMIITTIIMLVLTILTIFIALYLNTDLFKTNEELFVKFIGKNMDNIERILQENEKSEFESLLEENKYKTNIQSNINYVENAETTSENVDNPLNKIRFYIEGETDKLNNYDYKNFMVYNGEEKALDLELVKNEGMYGFRFVDSFKQYVFDKKDNVKQFLTNAGFTKEQIDKLPDEIDLEEITSLIKLTEDEKKEFVNKYVSVLRKNISKDKYSKQTNIKLLVNEKEILTNAYILKINEEQLNNCYINLLEILSQDEIVLSRLEKMQSFFSKYGLIEEKEGLRDEVQAKILDIIEKIKATNIGQSDVIITVYEHKGTTVSTSIETSEYKIDLDCLNSEFLQISVNDKEEKKDITVERNDNEIKISLNQESEKFFKNYLIHYLKNVEDTKMNRNLLLEYKDSKNNMKVNVQEEINLIEKLENEERVQNSNKIELNQLESERYEIIKQRLDSLIKNKTEKLNSIIKVEDIQKLLITAGIMKEAPDIEDYGITEAERNRYNSRFELLKGENLKKQNVLNIIEAIKDNLISVEVVTGTELKLNIDRNNKDENIAKTLSESIEKIGDKNYNIELGYDEETQLVNAIILKIIVEKR